jgi:glycosyltransferase involved in cell wall biosynthesis
MPTVSHPHPGVDPDISVIIPTFNRIWCLPEAIESCRHDACSTEIIVVDDGSTDGTWEWLQTQTDLVIKRQPNWGKDWAVNKAMSVSRGEFVRFLDSDDLLAAHANDEQLEIARRSRADVVVGGCITWDLGSGEKRHNEWVACDDFIAQQLGECDSSHYSAYLFRREFISDIPHRQEFGVRDDRMFIIEVAIKQPRVASCERPSLIHRYHDQERLQSKKGLVGSATNWSHLQIYRKAAVMLANEGKLDLRRRRAMARALWPLAHWIAYTHPQEARQTAAWVYELEPEFAPPEAGVLGYLYRHIGFALTEQILRVRRLLLSPFLRRRASAGPESQTQKAMLGWGA